MSRIAGVSCYRPYISAVAVENGKILGGKVQKASTKQFPSDILSSLADPVKPFDKIAVAGSSPNIPELKHDKVVFVEQREALASAAITINALDKCAILVVDDFETSIGYYVENNFYWMKTIKYPDSLCLFYSAAARLLGYDTYYELDKLEALSVTGKPVFCDVIKNSILSFDDKGGYDIKINLERGVGIAGENADIAASVQEVYTQVVLSLVSWMRSIIDINSLVFVGKGSENKLTATAVATSNIFTDTYFATDCSASSAALGAAALVGDVLWEGPYVNKSSQYTYVDPLADQLLLGKKIQYTFGSTPLSLSSMGSGGVLSIPYLDRLPSMPNYVGLVLERDYSKYFDYKNSSIYASTYVDSIKYPEINRVISVSPSTNPELARLLTITSSLGYPVLVYSDDCII